jgi:hypothetical protein
MDKSAYDRVYAAAHRAEKNATQKVFYAKHKDRIKFYQFNHRERISAWRIAHREELLVYQQDYRTAHPGEAAAANQRCRLAHPEQYMVTRKRWDLARPDLRRERSARHNAKRRVLGYIPLNEAFGGCEGHHLNESEVIYIPKELHRSVYHNIWTGKGMDEINALATRWLTMAGEQPKGERTWIGFST